MIMLNKILFLYHRGQGNIPVSTYSGRVSGGLSGTGQIFVILVVIALIGWFFWYVKKK